MDNVQEFEPRRWCL